uniref:NADH-ubiquinone oxidoreductase chain 6 n=2 Tax=unclassified Nephtys TaxID=2628724 RepID=B2C6R5_9ANNE
MLLTTLMCLIMSFSLSIMLTPSPLLLGVWILITALLISVFLATITYSWVGFLIFLIYVGGMLVMFAYFTAIQPNQFMQTNNMFMSLAITFLLFFMILAPFTPSLLTNMNLLPNFSILSLYSSPNIPILMFLGIMLFLALVAVVKVSKSLLGPLRPFN